MRRKVQNRLVTKSYEQVQGDSQRRDKTPLPLLQTERDTLGGQNDIQQLPDAK